MKTQSSSSGFVKEKNGMKMISGAASLQCRGIKEGTSTKNDTNGCSGSFNQQKPSTETGSDPTTSTKTIQGSSAISQHKSMAMGK